ncbi:MAG: recombinase family protein [Gammaproteobacteria bacterium]|nr:recombinase family protein [Gammaproteobacteria bacterium]
MNAIGYIRVSTQGQADDGISLDAQRAKITAWCECNGYTLAGIYEDAGISGTKADRPGLAAALAAVGKNDALVCYTLSRLARSTRHTLEIADRLEKAGADMVSLSERIDTTTAAGRMVFRMLAVLAEFERDQISERTKGALAHKKAQGERVGSVPYGKRLSADGARLEDHPEEQEAVRLVAMLRSGGMSYPRIAAELSARGHAPRGKAWHPQTIKNIAEAA